VKFFCLILKATEYWIGEEYFNFMIQLPVVVSTKHLPMFRQYVLSRHPAPCFDDLVMQARSTWDTFSQFCVYGNYLYKKHKDEFYWALEVILISPNDF
jgi:hypothetical protein